MSAKDQVHQHVVVALQKDGWTITHDPFKVRWKTRKLQIDIGAEKLIAAQKDAQQIAVEIKSFIGANDLEDLYHALGQFILYRRHCAGLSRSESSFWPLMSKHSVRFLMTLKVSRCGLRKTSSYLFLIRTLRKLFYGSSK